VSALYYVIVTVSTVGYGDLAPTTYVGRVLAIITIFGGISFLVMAIQRVAQVMGLQSSGRGSFDSGVRYRHIIVSGCPNSSMCEDFISELFHPDHAEDAEDLHCVFLFQPGTSVMAEVQNFVRQKENIDKSPKIHLMQGSMLDGNDMMRVSALKANCFFILPNTQAANPTQEDTENIIRMMALKRFVPDVRTILMLLQSDSQAILNQTASGGDSALSKNVTCVAMDQFKMEIIGKSCEVTGFETFICNLCKSIEDENEGEDSDKPLWQQDYERGVGNELYEIELSKLYSDRKANFCEVVIDVLEQTHCTVYLIGLVEVDSVHNTKKVLVNPGPRYEIKSPATGVATSGIFVASDRDSVVQCEGGMVFLGRRERLLGATLDMTANQDDGGGDPKARMGKLAAKPDLSAVDERLLQYMTAKQGQTARRIVSLVKQHERSLLPARPSMKMLSKGGHILLLCVGASEKQEIKVGVDHFVRPLRSKLGGAGADPVPIVVMAPQKPQDWENVCDQDEVYFLKGSPLSHFDLERANFNGAETIFICNVGSFTRGTPSQAWMVDSEVVCCTRLVESRLEPGSSTVVIAELNVDSNYQFLPVPQASTVGAEQKVKSHDVDEEAEGGEDAAKKGRLGDSMSSLRSRLSGIAEDSAEDVARVLHHPEPYYNQPRFASGQLFVGACITSMVVNTFYNPSLAQLVRSMVASNVVLVKVPMSWVGKSYFEFFDHLFWTSNLLSIAIFRRADPGESKGGGGEADPDQAGGPVKKFSFLYTAPPAKETTMLKTDRVMCFAAAAKKPKTGPR